MDGSANDEALGYSFTYVEGDNWTDVYLRGAQGALGKLRKIDVSWEAIDGRSTVRKGFPTRLAAAIWIADRSDHTRIKGPHSIG